MAFNHFGVVRDRCHEALSSPLTVLVQLYLSQDLHGETQLCAVENCDPPQNHPVTLHPLDTTPSRRRCPPGAKGTGEFLIDVICINRAEARAIRRQAIKIAYEPVLSANIAFDHATFVE